MSQETKYKTDTPEQIAKKYLQVTEFDCEGNLANDIQDYADKYSATLIKTLSKEAFELVKM